ncbi:MAG: adenylyltransferase/cytidyltransferase family protein [Dorea sp.]|nr:adenylyltransferase/cytidyltransferase family protein [Dorea sp.]
MQNEKIQFFAAYSKDDKVVYQSSSGGIFYELCKWVIGQNGVVYGVEEEDAFTIVHKRAESILEVEKFRKSKYVRSKLGACFRDAEQDLKNNKLVLFSGTGCQIAGLYHYLKIDYPKLYTVEVVCHGVPISEAYRKYIQEKSEKHHSRMRRIDFRDKRYGWKKNTTCEIYENGEEEACLTKVHPHHSAYVKGINVEAGCGKCPYAKLPRAADIALADFWQYHGALAENNKNRGLSLVVIKDSKGNELWENIKEEIYLDKVSQKVASESCRHLEHAPRVHVNQEAFQKMIKETSFETASGLCMGFGDVIPFSKLRIMHTEDADYAVQTLLEDNQEIIYLLNPDGRINGIVTFGAFIRAFPNSREWVNHKFQSVCMDDENCINKVGEILKRNPKINRVPITDINGKLLYEVRRTNGANGRSDQKRFILPFVRAVAEKRKCYFYKRPDRLADFSYSKGQEERMRGSWSFPMMSEDLKNYGTCLRELLNGRYSEEYVKGLCRIPQIIKRGRRYQHADGYSDLVNIAEGWRKTCYQPDVYKFTIHIYGRCGVFGYAVEDAETLPSFLQKNLKDMNIRVASHSTWGAKDEYIIQNLCEDLREGVIEEHDIILCYMKELPFMDVLEDFGIYCCDTTPAFHRALEERAGVDFYDMPGHMNAEGYQFIAQYIYEDLKGDLAVQSSRAEHTEHSRKAKKGCILNAEQEKEVRAYIDGIKARLPVGWKNKTAGAVLMNCDPFTKGHRYLIEMALKEVEFLYVFVVEEDKSHFSFQDRINMVRLGVRDLDNLIVIPSGRYIASVYTVPDYFFRNMQKQKIIDLSLDVKIFVEYIAPALHITKRFLGTEPVDKVTQKYNETVQKIMPDYGITVRIIERLRTEKGQVSAKTVRNAIGAQDESDLKLLVPESTFYYLKRKGLIGEDS